MSNTYNSYRTDQFYNFSDEIAGPGGRNPDGVGSKTNPTNDPYLWPGATRKHLGDDGKMYDKVVQRGFMRVLPMGQTSDVSLPNYRFFFQFNPQTINRELAMVDDVRHPLLQDVNQLSTPIPGRATFGFDMLIDRTFDMNNPMTGGTRTESDLLMKNHPDNIGVLSDIRMLDAVIGVGISEGLIEYVREKERLYYNVRQSDTASSDDTEEDSDSESGAESETSTTPFDSERFTINATNNIGNQAFLMPNPVRVVFSSLFMVDGFVTGITVSYIQFNEQMVPTRAVINVQMQAMYIGFAQKDTFLTQALALADADDVAIGPVDPSDPITLAGLTLANTVLKDLYLSMTGPQQELWSYEDPVIAVGTGDPGLTPQEITDLENLRLVVEFTNLPESQPVLQSDVIYRALSSKEIVRAFHLDSVEVKMTRRRYQDITDEPELDENGRVPLASCALSTISCSGAAAYEQWADKFFHRGGAAIKRGKSHILPNASYKVDNQFSDTLYITDPNWDEWKSEVGKVSVVAVARGRLELSNDTQIPLEWKQSGWGQSIWPGKTFRYNSLEGIRLRLSLSPIPTQTGGGGEEGEDEGGDTPPGDPGTPPSATRITVTDHPSTEWADPPISGGASFRWENIEDIVIHYPGGTNFDSWAGNWAGYMNNMQNDYVTNRGYSLGYNYVVTPDGEIWESRGDRFKNAANVGTTEGLNANDSSMSIQVVVNNQDAANAAQITSVKALIENAQNVRGKELNIKGHRDVGSTDCPGAGIYAQVQAGTFNVPRA